MKRWKFVLTLLSFSFIMGCAKEAVPSSTEEFASGGTSMSSGIEEQTDLNQSDENVLSQTDSTEESVPEKSRLETILEVQDEEERFSQLYSLLLEDVNSVEVAEAFLRQALPQLSLNSLARIPEEFRKEQKETLFPKLQTNQCEYAQYLSSYEFGRPKVEFCTMDKTKYDSVFCYDENNKVVYAPMVRNYRPSSFYYDDYSKEVFYHYDDAGYWIGTDRLVPTDDDRQGIVLELYGQSTEGWGKVQDKAIYDKEGHLSKVYWEGELLAEFQYNKEGSLTKMKNHSWNRTEEYKYDENGYLSKSIEYVDGEKQNELEYSGHFEKVVVSGPTVSDTGDYWPYHEETIRFNKDGTEMKVGTLYDKQILPYEFKDHEITVIVEEYESSDYLRICVSHQYGDGFIDVNSFYFDVDKSFNNARWDKYGYTLFYVVE